MFLLQNMEAYLSFLSAFFLGETDRAISEKKKVYFSSGLFFWPNKRCSFLRTVHFFSKYTSGSLNE
jgi:hypothetical protein